VTLRLRCGDASHLAEVRSKGGALHVTVDGQAFEFELHEVAPGTYLLRSEGRQELFHCVRDGDAVHLAWRGTVHRLEREREGARPAGRSAAGGLEAPMPGKVTSVRVVPGQPVRKGEEVLVVEAMKMENALRAPRDGTVKSVAVKVGDMVNPGVVLLELE
jgi:acetyl/propionyl-CoA carboxylase alpha subunit